MIQFTYQVAYSSPTNYISGVRDVSFSRNLHPKDDEFQITVVQQETFPNTPFTSFLVANQIFIYRNDGTTNAPNTTALVFRGLITQIHYKMTSSGFETILVGRGMWYLMETQLLSLGGFAPAPYPVTNTYIMALNNVLTRSFDMVLQEIMTIGFKQFSGNGLRGTITLANPTGDFASWTTTLAAQANAGDTSISVVSSGTLSSSPIGFLPNQLLFIGQNTSSLTDISNPQAPIGETDTISSSFSISSPTTVPLLNALSQTHASGSAVYNYVVNDQMLMFYQTIASAVERLVTATIPDQLGEYFLDFTQSQPTLSVKTFLPSATPPKFGIGVDKRVTQNVNPQIIFVEGQHIVNMDFLFDYESMANSVVYSGQQFAGAQISAPAIENFSSINQYGLKQINKSVVGVVDQLEISRFVNNILPLIAYPIPSINLEIVNSYNNSSSINPGDVVSITSPSLATITPTTFGMRIVRIERTWSVDTGEQTNIQFMPPLSSAGQWVSSFASPTLKSVIGGVSGQMNTASYQNSSGLIQDINYGFTFVLNGNISSGEYIVNIPINLTNQIMTGTTSSGTQVIPSINKFIINITAIDLLSPAPSLGIIGPDGTQLNQGLITPVLGEDIDLMPYIIPLFTNTGKQINNLSGNFILSFLNNVPFNVHYALTVGIAVTKEPT